jgi:RND family efflux transporter MFP subunit
MRRLGPAVALAAIALLCVGLAGRAAERGVPRANLAEDSFLHNTAADRSLAGPGTTFDCVMQPKLTVKLGSPDSGILDKMNVDRGDLVHSGEVVATLDSQLQRLEVRMAHLKAASEVDVKSEEARLTYRQAAARRNEALHQKSFVSTKDYDEAMVERQLAQLAVQKAQDDHQLAQVKLAQAEAQLDRRSIRTPVGGVVVAITSKPGEYVYDQTPVMTIADIDPLYVKVFVPVRYYRKITVGTNADVVPEQPIGGLYRARVSVVDRVFDAASATFGVRLVLPNPHSALPAGVRCRVHFLIKEAARGPLTPAAPPGAAPRERATPAP